MQKKFTLKTLAIALGFTLYSAIIHAQTTIYVSPTGVSSNAGTEASPKDVNSVFNTLVANTTVIMLDGIYSFSNDRYIWQKQGTATQPITIKAKNKYQAILKGNTAKLTDYYAVLYLSTCKHIIVDGLTVMNESNSLDISAGIRLGDGCDFITVKNCQVYGHGAAGITCEAGDNITIEDNIVYNNSSRNEINTSGISFYKAKPRTATTNYWGIIIRRNIIYGNKCDLPYRFGSESNVNPTDGNGIILDLLDDPYASGGANPYGKRVLVENNLTYNNGGAGIKAFNSSLVRIVNNTVYHNNTVLNRYSRHSNEIWVFETRGVNGVYNEGIYNNIVVADNALTTNVDQAIAVDFDLSKVYNNYLVGVGAKHNNYNYEPQNFPTSNTVRVISDQNYPMFVDAAALNFKLKSASPLIDRYTESFGPTVDLEGLSRPVGAGTDIGAYEYRTPLSLVITPRPIVTNNLPTLQSTIITNNKLSITGISGKYNVALLNSKGAKLITKANITGSIDVNITSLSSGMYIIVIDDGKNRSSQRILVQK
jgi:parallel beta-helix repeat protein